MIYAIQMLFGALDRLIALQLAQARHFAFLHRSLCSELPKDRAYGCVVVRLLRTRILGRVCRTCCRKNNQECSRCERSFQQCISKSSRTIGCLASLTNLDRIAPEDRSCENSGLRMSVCAQVVHKRSFGPHDLAFHTDLCADHIGERRINLLGIRIVGGYSNYRNRVPSGFAASSSRRVG
jgi:hypothetical protein